MIHALHNALDIQPKDNSSRTLTAYAPSDTQGTDSTRTPLMSFAPPAYVFVNVRTPVLRAEKYIGVACASGSTVRWPTSPICITRNSCLLTLRSAVHLQNHPRYQALRDRTSIAVAKNQLAAELWSAIAKAGVMIRRGELCAVENGNERAERGEEGSFLRASFGNGTKDYLQQGMTIFSAELIKFFE